MRRLLWISSVALGALALGVPANAGFGPAQLDNEYEGRAERDRFTYVGFDVRNQKVAKVTAHLRYTCDDGDEGPARAKVRGKLPLHDDRFAGTLRVTRTPIVTRGDPAPGRIKYRINGKLRGSRKAKGTIDAEIRFNPGEMRGGSVVRCYTGRLDWKAKRGADLDVPVLKP